MPTAGIPRRDSRIPKNIFQTFETFDLKPGMILARQTWIDQNKDYTVYFQDKNHRLETVAMAGQELGGAIFARNLISAYNGLTSGALKADIWRYCALFLFGGVYADIDSICLVPLQDVLRDDDEFVSSCAGQVRWAIFNGFIASRPRHPFLARSIVRAEREIRWGERDGYLATGPGNLGMAVNEVIGRHRKTVFESGDFDRYRLFRKINKSVFDGDVKIVLTEYDTYLDDLSAAGIKHWTKLRKGTPILQRIRRRFV